MSNQFILWSMLVIPWASLFLLKTNEIRRYMPMALFTIVTSVVIVDTGVTLRLWTVGENIYPLNELTTFVLGALPAFTIWIYKYTYGRYWVYGATELLLGMFFSFLFLPWPDHRGIFVWVNGTPRLAYLITIVHWNVIYFYQVWQERGVVSAEAGRTVRPRPALLKRFFPPRRD